MELGLTAVGDLPLCSGQSLGSFAHLEIDGTPKRLAQMDTVLLDSYRRHHPNPWLYYYICAMQSSESAMDSRPSCLMLGSKRSGQLQLFLDR